MSKHQKMLIKILPILIFIGCASTDPQTRFPEVKKITKKLNYEIIWNRSGKEDELVYQKIEKMMRTPLTIDEVTQIMLLNNNELIAYYENLGIAQADVVQAELLKNPVFNGVMTFPVEGGQANYTLGVVMDFLQVLFIPLRKRIANAKFEIIKLQVANKIFSLVGEARKAYYRHQADLQLLELEEQIYTSAKASYETAKQLYAVGNINLLNLYTEQSFYEQAKIDLAGMHTAVNKSRETLNQIMGLWQKSYTQWQITNRLPLPPDSLLQQKSLESIAVKKSLLLAIAKKKIEFRLQVLGFTEISSVIPILELEIEAEKDDGEWEVGPGISIELPIFDQGQARILRNDSELRQSRKMYRHKAIQIRSVARFFKYDFINKHRIVKHYKKFLLPLQEQIMNQTMLNYNAMQIGPFEILTNKRQQIMTARNYIESLYGYWQADNIQQQILYGVIPEMYETTEIEIMQEPKSEGGH